MSNIKSKYKKLSKLAKLSSRTIREFGFSYFINAAIFQVKKNKLAVFAPEQEQAVSSYSESATYNIWLQEHKITEEKNTLMKNRLLTFTKKPKISMVISVSEKNNQYLKKTLQTIIEQVYSNWEIYLDYPREVSKEIIKLTSEISDSRIISNSKLEQTKSLNNILSIISGEFVAFFNSGDVLTKEALFRIVEILNENPEADIIYSDEDKVNGDNKRSKPFFKPDWSPDLFLSMDYISNFYLVQTKLLNSSDKFKDQFSDAKHYELLLRLTEKAKKIVHVPTILVSSHVINTNSIEDNAKKAISDTLIRRSINGTVKTGLLPSTWRINYFSDNKPKVSIIIPTKDQKELLKRCITNIEKKTSYKNYEIIIINNNSSKEETLSYLKSLPYTVIKYDLPFNFSKINNTAASHASGDYLLFLNDDAAPLESDWLSEMVSICQQKNVGVVGAKLVFSSNFIQHAGVVLLKTGVGFHPMQGVDANSPGYFGFLNVIRDCSAVTGACLLIRKKLFDDIGGFDEIFDLYYQDVDLCLKAIKHGHRVVYTPYARLLHDGSSSIKKHAHSFFAVENHYEFLKKWPTLKNGDPYYNPNLTFDYRIKIGE